MIPDFELCKMSGEVYDDALITGEVAELEYQVCPREDEYVITVRGTQINSWMDVLRDLRCWPHKHPVFGKCHKGFAFGADALFEDVSPNLNKDVPLVLNGHSLGAAVSLKLSILLADADFNVRRWVGFGTPRGFLTDFELPFHGRAYVHKGDIVTMIPPWPYKHPGNIEVVRLGKRWRPSVLDHSITDGYLAAMA